MTFRMLAQAPRIVAAVLLSWFAVVADVSAQNEDAVVYPPGKTLGMVPPEGFKLSDAFSGFVEPQSGSSFLLVELPAAAYAAVKSGMTTEALASQKIIAASIEPIEIGGHGGLVVKGTQTVEGKQVSKWILLLGTDEATILLTAQDLTGKALDDATVMAVIDSVQIRKKPDLDVQVQALPFTLGDLAGFRVVRTIANSGVLLTKGPKNVVDDGSQPVLIIQRHVERPFPTSMFPADLADQLLRSVQTFVITDIGETVERTVAGAEGYETIATARDKVLDSPVVVGQWLRLHSGQQVHALAILPDENHQRLLTDLRDVVAALTLKAL